MNNIDEKLEKLFNCKKDLFQNKEWNWFIKVWEAATLEAKSETMFSLEDMNNLTEFLLIIVGNHWSDIRFELDKDRFKCVRKPINEFIQSLTKPKEYEFVPEMEHGKNDAVDVATFQTPKIVNNKIQGTWKKNF